MEKVEEDKGYMGTEYDSSEDMATSMIKKEAKSSRSLDELKAVKEKLEKKINEMEKAPKEEIKEYVGMSPDQMELVNTLGQLIAGGAASATVVAAANTLLDFIKGGKKPMDNQGSEESMEEAKDKEKKEAIKEAEEFNLSKHYRAGEPRVLNNAIAIDRLIKSSVKDISKARELIGLIILLADAFAEQRIGQLKGDQNWQYDKK